MSLLASINDNGSFVAQSDLVNIQLCICSIQNANSAANITIESGDIITTLRSNYPILANDAYDFQFKFNLKHKDKINFIGVGLCLGILQ